MGGISLITIYDRKFRHNRPEEGLPKMITYISPINMVAEDNHLYFAYKSPLGSRDGVREDSPITRRNSDIPSHNPLPSLSFSKVKESSSLFSLEGFSLLLPSHPLYFSLLLLWLWAFAMPWQWHFALLMYLSPRVGGAAGGVCCCWCPRPRAAAPQSIHVCRACHSCRPSIYHLLSTLFRGTAFCANPNSFFFLRCALCIQCCG